jgi:hypothetical protein
MAGLITFLESKMLSKYSIVLFVSFVYLISASKTHHGWPLVGRKQLLNSTSNDFLLSSKELPTSTYNAERLAREKVAVGVTTCQDIRKRNVDHMLHRIRESAP